MFRHTGKHPAPADCAEAAGVLLHENRVSLARESALQQLPQKQAFKINDSLLHTPVQLQYFEGLCQLVCQGVGTPYCHWSQCSATQPPPA